MAKAKKDTSTKKETTAKKTAAKKKTTKTAAVSKKATTKKATPKKAAPLKTAKPKKVTEAPVETVDNNNIITTTKAVIKNDIEDNTMLKKLNALYQLQQIDTQINKLRSQRGMLPVEVKDLEDTVAGLEIRLGKFTEDVNNQENLISGKTIQIKEALDVIKKYESQKENVKNNREFESLQNQIENLELDIRLLEKEIKHLKDKKLLKEAARDKIEHELGLYKKELSVKVEELDQIIAETTKEEEALSKDVAKYEDLIDNRLLTAYKRIRDNAKNGLAVVTVERNACGGCFNKIPPQRQLDIKTLKKIIVCEYCGRILVDPENFEKIN